MHWGSIDYRIRRSQIGAIAQLGERLLCKHQVVGSIPTGSTSCLQSNSPYGRDGAMGLVGPIGIRNNQVLLL